jgi:hypothetical protein
MPVPLEDQMRVHVPELLSDLQRVRPCLDHERRAGMPKVVKRQVVESRPLARRVEDPIPEVVGPPDEPCRTGEHQVEAAPPSPAQVIFENLGGKPGEVYAPLPFSSLRRSESPFVRRGIHNHRTLVQPNPISTKREQLALPHSGESTEHHQLGLSAPRR